MLTPILATPDPYAAAAEFNRAGWTTVFQTPADAGDPLACVELHGAQLMLGTQEEHFLSAAARDHRGAGVEFHLQIPEDDIETVHQRHVAAGYAGELTVRPWGERAFNAVISGYRFLIAAGNA